MLAAVASYPPLTLTVNVARNQAGGRALYVEGTATQERVSGGLIKAMVLVNGDGSIARCFNGYTNVSTNGCGFSVSVVASRTKINFGFGVTDRFVSVTRVGPALNDGLVIADAYYGGTANEVWIDYESSSATFPASAFSVIIF